MKQHFREGFRFLGLSEEESRYDDANYIILPVPYDGTTSYNSGTRNGPRAIIEASMQVELFDGQTGIDATENAVIHTMNEIEPIYSSPKDMVERIKDACKEIDEEKFIITLGGEHTISLGPILALKEKNKEFSVLQIDAHADLRKEYEGTEYNHACVMRRIHEKGIPFVSLGIRSLCKEEQDYIKDNKLEDNTIYGWELDNLDFDSIISKLGENVYITIDIDGFDPSVFPGTGTIEPGGLLWYQFLKLFKNLCEVRNIIGFDLVETIPTPPIHTCEYTAAKLIYKMISFMEVSKT